MHLAPSKAYDRTASETVGRCPAVVCSCQVHRRSQAFVENRPFQPSGAHLLTAQRNRMDTEHARLDPLALSPYASLLGRYRISTGSAVRSDSGYFQRPGSLVTSQDNLQSHNATVPLTTSHLLRLYAQPSHSPTPELRDIRRPQHRLCHLSSNAGGASHSRAHAKRTCFLKEAIPMPPRPPTPTPTPKFDAGVFKHLPSLGFVFNASRQMREVFAHRASKLMHGRVLDMSCRDSVQSLTRAGPPGPSRSSR